MTDEKPTGLDVDFIVVEAEHAVCGRRVLAFPAVIHSPGLVVILAGGIAVPMPELVGDIGSPGLLYECNDTGCGTEEWVFIPFDLETLMYDGDRVIPEFDDPRHIFKTGAAL